MEFPANHNCFGCFACKSVCAANAIQVTESNDGYLYPSIDAGLCKECLRCSTVCPSNNNADLFMYPLESFAGVVANADDFMKSSSGGAFKAIVRSCVKRFGADYTRFFCGGCMFDEGFKAVHSIVEITDEASVDVFSKSKYIQSNTTDALLRAKRILDNDDNYLIFSGTPCQIAGLKNYLGRPYENLLCIDLICHGAPSQRAFDDYVDSLESKYGSTLVDYQFRTKKPLENGTLYTRSAYYRFANGIERRVSRLEDDYLISFYGHTYDERPGCTDCPFKRPERISDITIGDAWKINELYDDLIPTQGASVIILVTDKAEELEPDIRALMKTYEVGYDFIVANNPPLRNER